VTRSEPSAFRWRRTAFTRIDGAVETAEDDWSLDIDGMSAARIYRVRGDPNDLAGDGRHLSAETAAREEALGDDLAAVTGTFDKGVELDALAKMDPVKRSGRLFNVHGVSFRFIGGGLKKNTNFEGSLVDALRCFGA